MQHHSFSRNLLLYSGAKLVDTCMLESHSNLKWAAAGYNSPPSLSPLNFVQSHKTKCNIELSSREKGQNLRDKMASDANPECCCLNNKSAILLKVKRWRKGWVFSMDSSVYIYYNLLKEGGHDSRVNDLCWSDDDGTLFSCSNDKHITEWNTENGQRKWWVFILTFIMIYLSAR